MSKRGKWAGRIAKKAMTRVMDRVGGKLVSGIADTSADAPASRFEPKRDLYRKMKEGQGEEEDSSEESS